MQPDLKQMYRTAHVGDFPKNFSWMGVEYEKVEDLRYGTNPHQPAAFYRPVNRDNLVVGRYEILKSGKSGLSQTNLEDIHHAVGILKYFTAPTCAVMKHCNPSGVATQRGDMSLDTVYERARDADAQAAFGGVVVFNVAVDAPTAERIMETVVECVAAPGFSEEALALLHDADRFKRNRDLRIIRLPQYHLLPRYVGDTPTLEVRVFDDGSLVCAHGFLTRMRSVDDFVPAYNEHPKRGRIECIRRPTREELEDLLFAWYVNFHVRSNGVVIARNGQTLAVGTGQQDRVGAVEQALAKAKRKYKGSESLTGAVMASDGFFPFRDAIDAAAAAGISAIAQPGGSVNDYEAIAACNEHNVAMMFTLERCFSHH